MKKHRIVAKGMHTAYGENPDYTALLASSEDEQVEVIFETMKAPVLAASVIKSSQKALKDISPDKIPQELAWHLESCMAIRPDAIDISLIADGDVLCINVGTGSLFFELTPRAKNALKNL